MELHYENLREDKSGAGLEHHITADYEAAVDDSVNKALVYTPLVDPKWFLRSFDPKLSIDA